MNKVLVTINVPAVEASFNVFLPINKKIGTVKKYLLNSISELVEGQCSISLDNMRVIDKDLGIEYENNVILKDSKIKNGSCLIIL